MLISIARGMMILHQLHIIHRDLKAENILVDEDFYPRITDFGLSKFFDPYHSMSQSIKDSGTAIYMAPEVIESDHFNTKADVYAFFCKSILNQNFGIIFLINLVFNLINNFINVIIY